MRTILRHSIGAVITLFPEVLPELSASRLVEVDLEASVKDGSVYNIKYQDPFLVITVTHPVITEKKSLAFVIILCGQQLVKRHTPTGEASQ